MSLEIDGKFFLFYLDSIWFWGKKSKSTKAGLKLQQEGREGREKEERYLYWEGKGVGRIIPPPLCHHIWKERVIDTFIDSSWIYIISVQHGM